MDTASAVHRTWRGSDLVIVDNAGHGGGGGFTATLTDALTQLHTAR